MKTYLIRACFVFCAVIISVAIMLAGKPATTAADTATATEDSASLTVETQPADLSKLVQPVYEGVTPAPAKNGPFGLVKSVPLNELSTAPAPAVLWYDTQEEVLAALKRMAPDSIIEGVLWEHAPPSGRSLTIYGTDCNNNGVANLGTYSFDNITSSLDNSCGTITLYFNTNYGGPQQSFGNGRTSNVGSGMNDQASSVFFNP